MNPEIIGALIGVGGTVAIGFGTLSVKAYIQSFSTNGKSKPEFRHCVDHYNMVEDITEIKSDVKWLVRFRKENEDAV